MYKSFTNELNNNIKNIFDKTIKELDLTEIQRIEILDTKELIDYPSLEFSRYVAVSIPLSISRLSIVPSQEDAPSNVLSTLARRFLDLQVVRAEVMLMTFEVSIDVLLPVHIYLLSNYEYDYRVKPPTIKTFIQLIKNVKNVKLTFNSNRGYLFKRSARVLLKNKTEFKVNKKREFLHYINFVDFVKMFFKRNSAKIEIEDELIFSQVYFAKKYFRIEIGTLRSMHSLLVFHYKKFYQRRRELNP